MVKWKIFLECKMRIGKDTYSGIWHESPYIYIFNYYYYFLLCVCNVEKNYPSSFNLLC